MNFKNFLFESILRFGRYGPKQGQPGTDFTAVPTGYLVWAMQNVGYGQINREQRAEIEEYLNSKNIDSKSIWLRII